MKERYKINVDMYECYDVEGQYCWEILNSKGYIEKSGMARTPLIAFAEAMEAYEELNKTIKSNT